MQGALHRSYTMYTNTDVTFNVSNLLYLSLCEVPPLEGLNAFMLMCGLGEILCIRLTHIIMTHYITVSLYAALLSCLV